MVKKDFSKSITTQWEAKTESVLETKLHQYEDENILLKEQIKILESSKNSDLSILKIEDIKLLSNIRDHLEYEDIESLSEDIKKHGQLQPVLISNDNYLLAGYRRYHAIKLISKTENENGNIICYKLKKNHNEIDKEELQEIQLAENEQRRSIDYFQLSKLYNTYKENIGSQKDLVAIFKKSKGTISAILKINNIDPILIDYIKQFQIYAWSKSKFEKFAAANFDNLDDRNADFYTNNKGIIGWRPLYEIAKNESLLEQKKVFIKLYKNRLTEEEIIKDFSELNDEEKANTKSILEKTNKKVDSIIKDLEKELKSENNIIFEKIQLKLKEVKEILDRNITK
jgi:ParB/RepB/Spo0J family partition protein